MKRYLAAWLCVLVFSAGVVPSHAAAIDEKRMDELNELIEDFVRAAAAFRFPIIAEIELAMDAAILAGETLADTIALSLMLTISSIPYIGGEGDPAELREIQNALAEEWARNTAERVFFFAATHFSFFSMRSRVRGAKYLPAHDEVAYNAGS